MLGSDGRPAPATVQKRQVRGVAITVIDSSGVFTGLGGPMATSRTSAPGYRLLGAIAEGPGGTVFFKLTGPVKTIAVHEKSFEQLLNSIQVDK